MDKELLRVVIILVGVLVMIGMVLWHFFKTLKNRQDDDDYGDSFDDRAFNGDEDEEEDNDDYGGIHLDAVVDGDALLDDYAIQPTPKPTELDAAATKPAKATDLPKLIEFSITARADQGFSGEELYDAFEHVGLTYGSVKVFERVDKNRLVDFTVASMGVPATFPETDLDQFFCPGIVFYMQPRELENPLAVFDDFVETIDILAEELDGVVWDNQKQPLTTDTIEHFRSILAVK